LVVDARSEKDNEDHSSECQWSGVFKKGFDRADTVRDYRLADKPGVGPEKKNLERGHGAVSIIHELQPSLIGTRFWTTVGLQI